MNKIIWNYYLDISGTIAMEDGSEAVMLTITDVETDEVYHLPLEPEMAKDIGNEIIRVADTFKQIGS